MNDEIKEILDWLKDEDIYVEDYGFQYKRISLKETKQLLDYITNLQQELEEANESITWWTNRFKAVERDNRELTQENEELKKKLDRRYYKNEYERIKQENEELKKNQRYYKNGVFSLEYDKETLSDMIDDYKSRCEKAIEYVNNYFVLGAGCDYQNNLLNILQNGSDEE